MRLKYFFTLSICLLSALTVAQLLPDIPICLNRTKHAGFDVHNPVRFAYNNWETSKISTAIARILLAEAVGIPNTAVAIDDPDSIWEQVASGDIHASLEYWPVQSQASVEKYINDDRTVLSAGPLGLVGHMGWFIPRYVLADVPEALYGDFSDPTIASYFNNTLIMGDKDWITVEQEIIEEHNYSLTIQTLSGIDELISVVMDKYSRKEPILFFMWQPHVLTSVLDVMRVHYLDEGNHYPPEILGKMVWPNMGDYSEEAMILIQTLNIGELAMLKMLKQVHENVSINEIACNWVLENEVIWTDWIRTAKFEETSSELTIAIQVVTAICLACTLFYLIAVIKFRKSKVIIASSGVFLVSMCIGGMLMFGSVFAFVSNTMLGCNLFIWMLPVGFALLFGSLFAKTGRIYLLFSNKSLQLVKYTDRDVGFGVGVILLGECVILSVMMGLQPADYIFQSLGDTDFVACVFHFPTGITLLVYNGIVMIFGVVISILISRLRLTLYNEAKYIGWAMYNFCFVVIFIVVIFLVADSAVRFALVCACVLFLTIISLSVLFIPKLRLLFTYSEEQLLQMNEQQLQAVIRSYTKKFASSSERKSDKKTSKHSTKNDTNKTSTAPGSFEDEIANLANSMRSLQSQNDELKKEVKKLRETTPEEYRKLYEKYYHESMVLKNQVFDLQGRLRMSNSQVYKKEEATSDSESS
jgi:glycine betaine/proline transport system substrate-binding protein